MTKYIPILLACLLPLCACTAITANEDQPAPSSSSVAEQQSSTPSESTPSESTPPSESASSEAALAPEDLPIDIKHVSYEDAISWETTSSEHDGGTFEMPEGWEMIDGTEYNLRNGFFVIPPDTDTEDFRFSPNVGVEVEGSAPDGAEIPDFGSEGIQKEFFAAQIARTYSKMGGLSDLEFLVWESEQSYVYIARFKRSNDELTMHQASYYVMNPDRMLYVNAVYFDEDSTPEINEVAQHLIHTYA